MTHDGKSYINIHHGGHEYRLQDNHEGRRVIQEIDEATKTGGRVTFNHDAGEASINLGEGGPAHVEYHNSSEL